MANTNGYYTNDHYGNYGYDTYGNSYNYSDSGYNSYNQGYGSSQYNDSMYNDSCATLDLQNGYDSDYDNVHPTEIDPQSHEGLARAVRSTEDVMGQIMRATGCQVCLFNIVSQIC